MPGVVTKRAGAVMAAFLACTTAAASLSPRALEAGRLLLAQDDPAALAETRLVLMQNRNAAIREQIEAALAAGDSDLAASFVALAQSHDEALPEELIGRVAAAVAAQASPLRQAKDFTGGLVTGEGDGLAGWAGVVAGDLFVFGDIRDVLREGGRLAVGEDTDALILGLAGAGLAVTAALYASAGGAAPLRAGLSVVKGARRAGHLSEPLARWGARAGREMLDLAALRQAMASASALRPAQSARAVKAALRAEKAGAVVRFGKDVGRIAGKAGSRGAMDVLKIADGPADVARAARLATAKGGETRALLKLFGRGALVLASGAFHLALWLFALLWMLFGMVASLKAAAERLTQGWCNRRRRLRAQRRLAAPRLAAAA